MQTDFESTHIHLCDSCGELHKLDEHDICCQCDIEHKTFNHAVRQARRNGLDREEAYKAGKEAQNAISPLLECFKSSDPIKQLAALSELPNKAMKGVTTRQLMREGEV